MNPTTRNFATASKRYFLKAIRENVDLTDHVQDAVNSLRIAFACDESVKTGKVVML